MALEVGHVKGTQADEMGHQHQAQRQSRVEVAASVSEGRAEMAVRI